MFEMIKRRYVIERRFYRNGERYRREKGEIHRSWKEIESWKRYTITTCRSWVRLLPSHELFL